MLILWNVSKSGATVAIFVRQETICFHSRLRRRICQWRTRTVENNSPTWTSLRSLEVWTPFRLSGSLLLQTGHDDTVTCLILTPADQIHLKRGNSCLWVLCHYLRIMHTVFQYRETIPECALLIKIWSSICLYAREKCHKAYIFLWSLVHVSLTDLY